MVDSSNINPNQGTNKPNNPLTQASHSSKPDLPEKHQALSNSLYKDPASSQQNDQAKMKNKDFDLRAKNPVLAAKLEKRKPVKINKKKSQSKPPKPGLKVQMAQGAGRAINPRRVKPSIPKRLQKLVDNHVDNMSRLSDALAEGEEGMHLINKYAKGLLESHGGFANMRSFDSLATLFGIDDSIAQMDKEQIFDLLEAKQEEFADEPQLKQILQNIVLQIQAIDLHYSNYLVPLLQLFLPIPFEFEFEELDQEFEEDEEETKDDEDRKQSNSEEEEFDATASLSIKTLNFNKLHILLCYKASSSKLIVNINGDPSAMEIAIPIESNLDDLVGDELNDIDYLIKIWSDNVLRVTEKRILKIKSTGELNPIMLRACNCILETIQNSDIDLDEESASQSRLL